MADLRNLATAVENSANHGTGLAHADASALVVALGRLEALRQENVRLRKWIDGLRGHGQISDDLHQRIVNGEWPKEQGA